MRFANYKYGLLAGGAFVLAYCVIYLIPTMLWSYRPPSISAGDFCIWLGLVLVGIGTALGFRGDFLKEEPRIGAFLSWLGLAVLLFAFLTQLYCGSLYDCFALYQP